MSKLPRSALHCSVVWACECIICFVALEFFLLFFSFPPFLSLLSCLVIWRNRKRLFPVKIWIEIVPTIRSQYSGTVYRAREETREDSERKEIGASKGDRSTKPALRSQFGIFFTTRRQHKSCFIQGSQNTLHTIWQVSSYWGVASTSMDGKVVLWSTPFVFVLVYPLLLL